MISPTIVDLRPSYYFSTAVVIILSCTHRHVRPYSMLQNLNIGDLFDCCFCEEEKEEGTKK